MLAMISNRLLLVQCRHPFEIGHQNNIFEPAAIDWNVDQTIVDKQSKLSKAPVNMMMTASSKAKEPTLLRNL